jgi:hypothetical protein
MTSKFQVLGEGQAIPENEIARIIIIYSFQHATQCSFSVRIPDSRLVEDLIARRVAPPDWSEAHARIRSQIAEAVEKLPAGLLQYERGTALIRFYFVRC